MTTEQEVIREALAETGTLQQDLAGLFGVSQVAISKRLNNESYRWALSDLDVLSKHIDTDVVERIRTAKQKRKRK